MNDPNSDDPLWTHFGPLYSDLQAAGSSNILVAGGYGLFLKQKFLLANAEIPVVVPLDRWSNANPRVTQDIDFLIGLDRIADEKSQRAFKSVFDKHEFSVSKINPRWQFDKEVSESKFVVVDLLAPCPSTDQLNLKANSCRVKSRKSLGEGGFHGRTNNEAGGADLQPFSFQANSMTILTPNPVTWSIMKLTAMNYHWSLSDNESKPEDKRESSRKKAIKHAQDLCRVVAMVTRDESDALPAVLKFVRELPEFAKAKEILDTRLSQDERLAAQIAAGWSPEDLKIIRTTLSRWFR